MAPDTNTTVDDDLPRPQLRVRLHGPAARHAHAKWALEALLARIRVSRWRLAGRDEPAELVWGSAEELDSDTIALRLPADAEAWEFRPDAPPPADRDPLAFTFWWLARVEEQLAPPDAFDEHDRFRADRSAIVRGGDPLATPVDDLAASWAERLAPWQEPLPADAPRFRILTSHDIDLPWRWTRAGRRRALRLMRDRIRAGSIGAAMRTLAALLAMPLQRLVRRDPWSNFARIRRLEREHAATSTSYLLVGRHAPEDGGPELHERGRGYVPVAAGDVSIGEVALHGSFTSSVTEGRLAEERAELEQRLGRPIRDHRFHYLRHRPDRDWRQLDHAGLHTDASLGFAEAPGFRAGTAHPFRAWNHSAGRPLQLVVVPLAVMDASYDERYLALGRSERMAHMLGVLERVRDVRGSASLLVHNDRLCNVDDDGWTTQYRQLLRWVNDQGGSACTATDVAAAYRALLPDHAPQPLHSDA